MKVILQKMDQTKYDVEIPSDQVTISELKNGIETQHGINKDEMKLVFSRQTLDNAKTVGSYNIMEGTTIIILIKNKYKGWNQKNKKISSSDNAIAISNGKEDGGNNAKDNIKNNINKEDHYYDIDEDYKVQMETLLRMGYDKEESLKALKSANGIIDDALEYLKTSNQKIREEMQKGNNNNENNIKSLISANNNTNNNSITNTIVPGPKDNNKNDDHEISRTMKAVLQLVGFIKIEQTDDPNILNTFLRSEKSNSQIRSWMNDNQALFDYLVNEPINEDDIKNHSELVAQSRGSNNQIESQEQAKDNKPLTHEETNAIQKLREFGFTEGAIQDALLLYRNQKEMPSTNLINNTTNNGKNIWSLR